VLEENWENTKLIVYNKHEALTIEPFGSPGTFLSNPGQQGGSSFYPSEAAHEKHWN
jgi:hypothetical protein